MRIIALLALLLFSCTNENKNNPVTEKTSTETVNLKKPQFSVITTEQPGFGWGYQIFEDGKMMIDQKHIPAVQGNVGFSSKEKAEKTANFVVEKIKKGSFPPTISIEELDSLGVLK